MGRNLEAFILQNFKKAIDYHEIQAFYQPVIRTSSKQLCSFEALARWIDPQLGMICPVEFIPVLEREGLIHLLDTAMLRQVCAQMRSAFANGETPIPVSVNLSRLDFTLCDIFTLADDIISDYQIPHDFICFEITESVMAEQKDMMTGIVDRFRAAGYQICCTRTRGRICSPTAAASKSWSGNTPKGTSTPTTGPGLCAPSTPPWRRFA